MKHLLYLVPFFLSLAASSQKSAYFKDIQFDDSYSVIGLCQGHGKPGDSLERFSFIVDNLADLEKLKSEWVFSNPEAKIHAEERSVEIYIIKDKQPTAFWSLIWPLQGVVLSENRYYKFDTTLLLKLHAAHPMHYRKQQMQFETYAKYASYGNTILSDSNLLFFFEPSMRYEGQFTIITRRTADPSDPIFKLRDINKELRMFDPSGKFQAGEPINDSFNISHPNQVKYVVNCSKALYEDYQAIGREKGPWEPTPIEITTFWRANP
jgi:hypothetical protein